VGVDFKSVAKTQEWSENRANIWCSPPKCRYLWSGIRDGMRWMWRCIKVATYHEPSNESCKINKTHAEIDYRNIKGRVAKYLCLSYALKLLFALGYWRIIYSPILCVGGAEIVSRIVYSFRDIFVPW